MTKIWWLIFAGALVWSGIHPHDYFTWVLEICPIFVALPAMLITKRKFPLTRLAYTLLLIEFIILMIGGHYTYAEMPLFNWVRDTFHQSRNNYDKLGHLFQGIVPAIVAREVLIRRHVVNGRKWLAFLTCCFCLAFSACYELFEWMVAVSSGDSAEAFLGTQGDVWDTQSDMACALIGSILSQLAFWRIHDRQIKALPR